MTKEGADYPLIASHLSPTFYCYDFLLKAELKEVVDNSVLCFRLNVWIFLSSASLVVQSGVSTYSLEY